jgi:hypothetical protein
MAWSTAYPSARQAPVSRSAPGSNGMVFWNSFRTMRGRVEMRLTDVTENDYRWYYVDFFVQLRNSAGVTLGSARLSKTWGVLPGFTYVGYVGGSQSVQLGTWIEPDPGSSDPYPYVDWSSELRWDNSQPT